MASIERLAGFDMAVIICPSIISLQREIASIKIASHKAILAFPGNPDLKSIARQAYLMAINGEYKNTTVVVPLYLEYDARNIFRDEWKNSEHQCFVRTFS